MNNQNDEWWKTQRTCSEFSHIFKGLLLGLHISGKITNQQQSVVYSGFLITYMGTPLWITAGHVIEEIEEIIQNPVNNFKCIWLDWASIPLLADIKNAFKGTLRRNNIDIGFIGINLLEFNNFKENKFTLPFNLPSNGPAVFSPQHFYLLGFPKDLQANNSYTAVCLPIEEKKYSEIKNKETLPKEKFYGKVVNFADNPDYQFRIKGMSGGPLVGVSFDIKQKRKSYSLWGIQSSILPKSRIVTVEPIENLITFLKEPDNFFC